METCPICQMDVKKCPHTIAEIEHYNRKQYLNSTIRLIVYEILREEGLIP